MKLFNFVRKHTVMTVCIYEIFMKYISRYALSVQHAKCHGMKLKKT